MSYTKAELIVLPIALITMITITFLLHFFLKDKAKRIQDIPFQVITILLIFGEIIKQILEFNEVDGYDFWAIPLHFCSTYFFWFALAEFSKGSFKTTMENIAFVASVYLVVGFYTMPKGIIGSACENIFENYSTFHTFFFHHLVLFYFILGIAFKRYTPKKQYVKAWVICFSAYFILATTCAHLLNTNYFNLLESNIPLMESFRLWAGQITYTFVMAFVTIAGGAIFLWVTSYFKNKKLQTSEE